MSHPEKYALNPTFSGNPADWPNWKFQFMALLGQHEMTELTELHTKDEPWTEARLNAMQGNWRKKNQKLMYLLVTAMAPSVEAIAILRRCRQNDGVQGWAELHTKYESSHRRRKHQLKQELLHPKPITKANLEEWITQLYHTRDQLQQLDGSQIDDDTLSTVLINALPSNMAVIKDHLVHFAFDKPFAEQVDIIRSHLINMQYDKPMESSTAFKANTAKQCSYCKNNGHTRDECRKLQREKLKDKPQPQDRRNKREDKPRGQQAGPRQNAPARHDDKRKQVATCLICRRNNHANRD